MLELILETRSNTTRISQEVRGAEASVCPHAWREVLEHVLQGRHAEEPLPLLPREADASAPPLFIGFLRPFLQAGAARLRAGLPAREGAEVRLTLLEALANRLQLQASRTLALELHLARLMNLLQGDSLQARFTWFATSYLGDPEVLRRLLDEYPVLARLLSTSVANWVESSLELLERLSEERPLLQQVFSPDKGLGRLVSVKSDPAHLYRGGRGPLRLAFASGTRLVHEPHSLALQEWFQSLVRWLNAAGLRHPLRELRLLSRGSHGWSEWVPVETCSDWQQGSLLALRHLLQALDLPFEELLHTSGLDTPATHSTEHSVGFRETCELLLRHPEELASRLRGLAGVELRHHVRDPRCYATLLAKSYHPDQLQEESARDEVLAQLRGEAEHHPELWRVLPYEKAELRAGDLPFFSRRPGQRHLWSSTGQCIPDFFERDSLGEVLARLARGEAPSPPLTVRCADPRSRRRP